jgi:hypothetical protein
MTTNPSFPGNLAILFGVIDARPQTASEIRKGVAPEAAVRRFRTPARGEAYTVDLQMPSPYSNAIGVRLAIGSGVDGAQYLRNARPGEVFVFEGHLVQREEVDRRFADYSEEAISDGIHYRDVTIKVASVRPRADGDPSGTGSSVWLEGEVIEPPAFFRHPEHPETQMARMRLRTQATVASGDEAFFPTLAKACDVTVMVPVTVAGAGYLYRQGNRVQVRGMLERVTLRQRGADVRERLAALETAWQETYARVQDKPQELQKAGSGYMRERERLEIGARTMVLAAAVIPLEGALAISIAEAQEAREQFIKEIRRRRSQRRQQVQISREARARVRAQERADAPASDAEAETDTADATLNQPGALRRRRRRVEAEASIAAPVQIDDAETPIGIPGIIEPAAFIEQVSVAEA